MMESLLRCPFCGSSDATMMQSDEYRFVECQECFADGPPVKVNDPKAKPTAEESAAEGWNMRAQRQPTLTRRAET